MDVEKLLAATTGHAEATRRRTSADRPNRLALIDPDYNPDRYVDGQNPRVVFDGEGEPTRRRWPVVGSYWPHPGDRVVMLPVGKGDWVILGSTMSADGPFLHVAGQSVAGNMVSGSVTIQAPGDFTEVTTGRAGQRMVEFGPLPGPGATRVFTTPDSESGTVVSSYTHTITSSSAIVRVVDTLAHTSETSRIVQWVAVRGLG